MRQYLQMHQDIVDHGVWMHNERTGKNTKALANYVLRYNVGANEFPLVTTRKSYWKAAIAELLGYIRGYDNAAQFRALGTKTWDANANLNEAWLNNPHRKGTDDMGRVYGVIGKDFGGINQLRKVYDNLSRGIDDRGEILTFWKPDEFDQGCLRPCMHTHTFTLLGDTLHLASVQRSGDGPLGINFNCVQVFVLLALFSQITGYKAGMATHLINNVHIYEDQYDLMLEQLKREPFPSPTLWINPKIKTLEDLETWVTLDDFDVIGYEHHDPIAYPFAV